MSSKEKTMVLCRVALLAAAYFVLSITLTIKTEPADDKLTVPWAAAWWPCSANCWPR